MSRATDTGRNSVEDLRPEQPDRALKSARRHAVSISAVASAPAEAGNSAGRGADAVTTRSRAVCALPIFRAHQEQVAAIVAEIHACFEEW